MRSNRAGEIYEFIQKYVDEYGYPPSIREICKAADLKSTSSVYRYINILVGEGLLEKNSKRKRSLQVSGRHGVTVPVLRTVLEYDEIICRENIEDFITISLNYKNTYPLFAHVVSSETEAKELNILKGDIIICEQVPILANDTISLLYVNDKQVMIRKYQKIKDREGIYTTEDSTKSYPKRIRIIGKIIALQRNMEL